MASAISFDSFITSRKDSGLLQMLDEQRRWERRGGATLASRICWKEPSSTVEALQVRQSNAEKDFGTSRQSHVDSVVLGLACRR